MGNNEQLLELIQTAKSADPVDQVDIIIDSFSQAKSLIDPAEDPGKWSAMHIPFAECLSHSRPDEALQSFAQALAYFSEKNNAEFWRYIHGCMGEILFFRSAKDNDAIEKAIEHLEIAVKTQDDFAKYLGMLYQIRRQGDRQFNWQRQIEYFEAALSRIDPSVNPHGWVNLNNTLADAFQAEPNADISETVEKRLIGYQDSASHLSAEDGEYWVATQIGLSECYSFRMKGDAKENKLQSKQHAEAALAACTDQTSSESYRLALQTIVQALTFEEQNLSQHVVQQARGYLFKALSLVDENTQPEAAADICRSIALLLLPLITQSDHEHLEELICFTQKGRLLLAGLRPGRELTLCRIEGEALFTAQEYERAVEPFATAMEIGLSMLSESTAIDSRLESVHNFGNVGSYLCHCYIELGKLEHAIRSLQKGKGAFWNPDNTVVDPADITALIPDNGALLMPCFTIAHGNVIVATQHTIEVINLPDFTGSHLLELQRGANHQNELGGWLMHYLTLKSDMAALGEKILALGQALYQMVWRPILTRLRELGLSSDAELVWFHDSGSDLFPMHAAWHETAGQVNWLTQDIAIRYAPSLRILRPPGELAKRTPVSSTVIVSDPNADLNTEELENSWISEFHNSDSLTILRGEQADKNTVIKYLTQATTLHFSCHAEHDIENPWHSHLKLANDEELNLEHCYHQMIDGAPSLITLSACETAIVKVTSLPNENLGFPSAFLYAGAQTVLAAMWQIDDRVAALMIGRFYAELAQDKSPARALQAAQIWLRDLTTKDLRKILGEIKKQGGPAANTASKWRSSLFSKDRTAKLFASPSYWAAFAVFGN